MTAEAKTPLFDWHVGAGAKMVPFAGFSMPIHYSGIQAEHLAVRNAVGLFDVSHMGNFLVKGKDAMEYMQRLTTNNVSALLPMDVQYSAMCYENGTVVDDILVTYVEPMAYHMVVNAANIKKDWDWMEGLRFGDVTLKNQSNELSIIALQGPKSEAVAQKLTEYDLSELGTYKACSAIIAGNPVVLSRTGYTGEDGFEFFPKNKDALSLWCALMESGSEEGILPIGLGARDTLRLEAGYSLYGHEINSGTNLVEAGLSWIVDWDGPNFTGKSSLVQAKTGGTTRKLVGIEMLEKAIPREGYTLHLEEAEIGIVTSGGMSPVKQKGIALAYVSAEAATPGAEVAVLIRGQMKKARVTSRRFYQREK